MVKYLLDTNIISEIRKGPRCHPNVAAWYSNLEEESLYLSVLVLGEIQKGIEVSAQKDRPICYVHTKFCYVPVLF